MNVPKRAPYIVPVIALPKIDGPKKYPKNANMGISNAIKKK